MINRAILPIFDRMALLIGEGRQDERPLPALR